MVVYVFLKKRKQNKINNPSSPPQAMNVLAADKGLMKDLVSFPGQHKFKGDDN